VGDSDSLLTSGLYVGTLQRCNARVLAGLLAGTELDPEGQGMYIRYLEQRMKRTNELVVKISGHDRMNAADADSQLCFFLHGSSTRIPTTRYRPSRLCAV
jgi:hypothetical protein